MTPVRADQRRCCLSTPGADPRMIAKAVAAGADEVVPDLEDAVPRSEKAAARQVVASWLRSADEGEDRPGRLLDGVEAAAGRAEPVALQALIETPAGLANVREIAAASPRLKTLIIGYADLAASLGRGPGLALESWLWAQDTVLTAARTAGIAAVDGPHLGVRADEAFEASV